MKRFFTSTHATAMAVVLTCGVLVGAGLFASADNRVKADDSSLNTYQQLDLFGEVFERIRAEYVDEISDQELIQAAISGMLRSLDPHSDYLDPDTYQDMQVQTRGSFGGLGIEVSMENGLVRVVSPIDDTPAYEAGIEAGDFITQIDGESVLDMDLSEAVDMMRGDVGTSITITIVRGDDEPFEVELERDVIEIQAVRMEIEDDVGYIRISSFTEQTTEGLREVLEELEQNDIDDLAGIVLDMRNNPGGLLDQAVDVADLLLNEGEIVSTRPRDEDQIQRFNANDGALVPDIPMIVLINDGSASASEIVAGALQDHGRALVMGTQSYGKGSVQTVIPLPGNGAMRLTTARHYTPSGRSIQAEGIEPDIEVRQAILEEIDRPVRREADLEGALRNLDDLDLEDMPSEMPEALFPDDEDGDEVDSAEAEDVDYQLERAKDLLRGMSLFSQSQMR